MGLMVFYFLLCTKIPAKESEVVAMKKKWGAIFLTLALASVLTACGSDSGSRKNEARSSGNPDAVKQSSNSEQTIPKNGKPLIAYFTVAENSDVDVVSSASMSEVSGKAKGRMTALAEMIQENTGGDLFSIKTSVKYPGDIGKLVEYVRKEREKGERPDLISHIGNLEDYDVIFVGFPTWWYDLPQIMYNFFDKYDFSGKTIIPFNSNNSSQFSEIVETIQDLEPDATVIKKGFAISEQDVPKAEDDIKSWLGDLGF